MDYPAKAVEENLYYLICNDKKVFIVIFIVFFVDRLKFNEIIFKCSTCKSLRKIIFRLNVKYLNLPPNLDSTQLSWNYSSFIYKCFIFKTNLDFKIEYKN